MSKRLFMTKIKNPFVAVLTALCGGNEPPSVAYKADCTVFMNNRGNVLKNLSDKEIQELQWFASENCVPFWSTGIGTLDAASVLVEEAIGNHNIDYDNESKTWFSRV